MIRPIVQVPLPLIGGQVEWSWPTAETSRLASAPATDLSTQRPLVVRTRVTTCPACRAEVHLGPGTSPEDDVERVRAHRETCTRRSVLVLK